MRHTELSSVTIKPVSQLCQRHLLDNGHVLPFSALKGRWSHLAATAKGRKW